LIGTVSWLGNSILGALLYEREWVASLVLLASAVLAQLIVLVAVITII